MGLTGPEMAARMKKGARVVRGMDWGSLRTDQEDGSPPGPGTVVQDLDSEGFIRVRWDSGFTGYYCMGADGKYELALAREQSDGNTGVQPTLLQLAEQRSAQQPVQQSAQQPAQQPAQYNELTQALTELKTLKIQITKLLTEQKTQENDIRQLVIGMRADVADLSTKYNDLAKKVGQSNPLAPNATADTTVGPSTGREHTGLLSGSSERKREANPEDLRWV